MKRMQHPATRLAALAMLVTATAAACGTTDPSTQAGASDRAKTSPSPTIAEPSAQPSRGSVGGGVLKVTTSGDDGADAVRYVRIESLQGETIVEKEFRAAALLTQPLVAGSYRLISWRRKCTHACPDSGERGLGTPTDICGVKTDVAPHSVTRATLSLSPNANCTFRLTSSKG